MKVELEIPEYDGDGIDIIWDSGSQFKLECQCGQVVLTANSNALLSLAKQMVYLASNTFDCGCHVHYDDFVLQGANSGMEFVIEKCERGDIYSK